MLLYFGKVGFDLNIFFISFVIKGWFLNVILLGSSIIVERVYFVVFKELYVNLCLYCVIKKLILFVIVL